MKCIKGNPRGDFLGPLDGEAPGWVQEIFEEERFDLRGGFEAVGVEVNERARRAAMNRVDVEGGAGDMFLDVETTGEALHKGGFSNAEVTVKSERAGGRQGGGELGSNGLRLCGGGGDNAGTEFIVDAHSRKIL